MKSNRSRIITVISCCVLAIISVIVLNIFFEIKFALLLTAEMAVMTGLSILWNRKAKSRSVVWQALFISVIISLFMICALISTATVKTNIKWILAEAVFAGCLLSGTVSAYISLRKGALHSSFGSLLMAHRAEILLGVIVFAMRIWMVGTPQRWDAGEYYSRLATACAGFDFTPHTFFETFRLAGHPTLGYAGIMAIGEFLDPRGVSGVLVESAIMTSAAVIMIYRLLRNGLSNMTEQKAFAGALASALIPLFWGTFAYWQIDYGILIFTIYLLYADIKSQNLNFFFFALLLCQTKETGIIVFFGYMVGRLLGQIFSRKTGEKGSKCHSILHDMTNWAAVAAAGVFVLYIIRNGGISSWSQSQYVTTSMGWSQDSNAMNTFAFRPDYIAEKLYQLFIVNYSWLVWLAIIICSAVLIIKYRKSNGSIRPDVHNLSGVTGALIAFAIFSCLYVTASLYRYNYIFIYFAWVICYILMCSAFQNKSKVCFSVAAAFCLLFSLQTFTTTDPVTNMTTETMDTGSGTKMLLLREPGTYRYSGDHFLYNYQYTWLDRALDAMLKDISYESGEDIILAGKQTALIQINGNGSLYRTYWDESAEKRTQKKSENTSKIPATASKAIFGTGKAPSKDTTDEVPSVVKNLSDKTVVFFTPYFETDEKTELDKLGKYFYIGPRRTYSEYSGTLVYYELIKKPEYSDSAAGAFNAYGEMLGFKASVNDAKSIKIKERKLADYNSLKLSGKKIDISEKEAVISALQKYKKQADGKREITKAGDTVAINFAFYIDGVFYPQDYTYNGESGKTFVLGSGELTDGIENKLTGKKVGERITCDVVFPGDYKTDAYLAGKKVKLTCTILGISTETPELTDKWVKDKTEFNNVKAFKENAVKEFTVDKLYNAGAGDTLLDALCASAEIETAGTKKGLKEYAEDLGIPYSEFKSVYIRIGDDMANVLSEKLSYYSGRREAVINAVAEMEGLPSTAELSKLNDEELLKKYGIKDPAAICAELVEKRLIEKAVS